MGKQIAKKIRGMNLWAKVSLVTAVTLLISVFMYEGWYTPRGGQAVATYQAVGTYQSGTGALTVPWPTHQTGDVALLFVETPNSAVSLTTPAGFVEVTNSPQSTGTANTAGGTRLAVYWCRATSAGMASPVLAAQTNHQIAVIVTFRGVISTGNPFEVSAGSVKATASTSTTFPAVTTTTAGDLIVLAAAVDLDSNSTAVFSGFTNSNLTGITEQFDRTINTGVGGGLSIATGDFAVAGSTGTTTGTLTSSITTQMTIALKPEPDTTPPTVSSVAVQSGSTVDVTFSEAMGTGVTTAANYTVSGTGKGTLANNPNSVALVSGNTYRLTWSAGEMLNGGDLTITVANAQDALGNTIGSPNSGTDTGGAIGVPPTVTINQEGGQADPTGSSPINFTVVFSEATTTFATGDVTITGTAGGTKTATVTGSGTTYNVAVSGMTTAGTVIANIGAGVATDAVGNANTASTSSDNTVSFTVPVVNDTTAAALTFSDVTHNTIGVTAPFTGDTNGNNGCVIRWGTVNGTYPNTATSSKSGNSYVATVNGLSGTTAYYFQATFTDADGITGSPVTGSQATIAFASPLVHNSDNLGTGKGVWGTAYTCATCHNPNTTNVKLVAQLVDTPIGLRNVVFTRMTANRTTGNGVTGVFGNDARTYAQNTSTNICSVCHHKTIHHQYSTSSTYPGYTKLHYNNQDCVTCHLHSVAFAKPAGASHSFPYNGLAHMAAAPAGSYGDCTGCHSTVAGGAYPATPLGDAPNCTGCHLNATNFNSASAGCADCHGTNADGRPIGSTFPDIVGSHSATGHVSLSCATCHNGAGSGTANHGSQNQVPKVRADVTVAFTGTGSWSSGPLTCSATYCHSTVQSANGTAAGVSDTTPAWGSGTATCATNCHGNTVARLTTGSHVKHIDTNHATYTCYDCHTGGGQGTPAMHANSQINVAISATYGGTYANPNGAPANGFVTCSTVYCHSSVQLATGGAGAPTYQTPSWGGAVTTCASCHGNTAATLLTGSHAKHLDTNHATFGCVNCHNGFENGNNSSHVNKIINVQQNALLGTTGTYTDSSGAPGNGFGTCGASYCHSSVQAANGTATRVAMTPTWGGAVTTCASCHGNTAATLLTGSHAKHLDTNHATYGCVNCHSGFENGNNSSHVNQIINVQQNLLVGSTGTYTDAAGAPGNNFGTCGASYCHSTVQSATGGTPPTYRTQTWGGAVTTCATCHGNTAATLTTGSHAAHLNVTYAYACSDCHGTPGGAGNTAIHADQTINVVVTNRGATATYTGDGTPQNSNFGVCNNTNCHGTNSPTWNTIASTTQCTKCHGQANFSYANISSAQIAPGGTGVDTAGNTAATSPRVGAHQGHLLGSSNISDKMHCGECHVRPATVAAATHLNFTTATVSFANAVLAKKGTVPHNPTAAKVSGIINCNNTYCHTGNYAGGTTPVWNNTALLAGTISDCTKCHALPPTPGSGSHAGEATVSTIAGLNQCSSQTGGITGCHPTISGTPSTYANIFFDKLLHINGKIEAGHAFPYTGTTHMSPAGTTPWSACNTCHNTTATGVTYATWITTGHPTQTAPNCTTCHIAGLKVPSGTSSCWDCHGASATDGRPNGNVFPNYSASHTKHVVGQSMACAACHDSKGGGIGDATHGSSNAVNHTYAFVNVTSTTKQFHYVGTGTNWKGTCSNVACHGTAIWGVTKFDCVTCHNAIINAPTYGAGKTRRAISTEFGANWSHAKTGGAVTKYDCGVCHMEGSPTTGATASPYHGNGLIDLRDPDTGTTITNFSAATYTFGRFSTSLNGTKATVAATNTTPYIVAQRFCLKCHDAGGAGNSAAYRTGGTTTKPFGATRGTVLDMDIQFATTNASAHPVKGPRQNNYCNTVTMNAPYGVTKTAGSTTLTGGVVITCWDCHNTSAAAKFTTKTIDSHGSGALTSILRGTYSATLTQDTFCSACHKNYTTYANSAATYPHGTRGNMNNATISGYCQHCHSGTPTEARPERAKSVHGFNTRASAYPSGQRPFAFLRNTLVFRDWKPKQSQPAAANTAFGCSISSSGSSNGEGCTHSAMSTFYDGTFSSSPTTVYGPGGIYPAY